jgi:hypothetical protein
LMAGAYASHVEQVLGDRVDVERLTEEAFKFGDVEFATRLFRVGRALEQVRDVLHGAAVVE